MEPITATLHPKYKVKALLDALSPKERKNIKATMMDQHTLSDATYSRYINLRNTDSADIPASVLKGFAELLHVDLNQLFTA